MKTVLVIDKSEHVENLVTILTSNGYEVAVKPIFNKMYYSKLILHYEVEIKKEETDD